MVHSGKYQQASLGSKHGHAGGTLPESEKRLDLLAARTGRSKSILLKEIIERGLEDTEDYYLAHQVLERVRSGQETTYSAAEVRRDLALDN